MILCRVPNPKMPAVFCCSVCGRAPFPRERRSLSITLLLFSWRPSCYSRKTPSALPRRERPRFLDQGPRCYSALHTHSFGASSLHWSIRGHIYSRRGMCASAGGLARSCARCSGEEVPKTVVPRSPTRFFPRCAGRAFPHCLHSRVLRARSTNTVWRNPPARVQIPPPPSFQSFLIFTWSLLKGLLIATSSGPPYSNIFRASL